MIALTAATSVPASSSPRPDANPGALKGGPAQPTELGKGNIWQLENDDVRMSIEQQTGLIRSLYFKRIQRDLFTDFRANIPGYIAGLRIYDERDNRWYDDLQTPFTVSDTARQGNTIRLTRHYKDAPFVVTVTLRLEDDAFHWEVQAAKTDPTVPDRSLRVHFTFPLIDAWSIWAPCKFGEREFDGMTPFEFMYLQATLVSEQDIILPMVSHFSRRLNVGYSMMVPIDAQVPAAKFVFSNAERCYNFGSMHQQVRAAPVLEGVNYYIGLVADRPMKTKVMLMFHEGSWRSALGKVYKRWQEYFDPYNPAIYDRLGCFLCGGVRHADRVDQLVKMGLKTLEVHAHFQEYSDYFNSGKDKWYRLWIKEGIYRKMRQQRTGPVTAKEVEAFMASHSDEQIAEYLEFSSPDRMYHPRDDVKRRLAILAEAGVACHWYFNYSDGYRPRVERDWPDSISRDEDGKPIPSGWQMCHNMNADPQWSFGRFCYDSARRIVDEYPMLSGFFLDCFRHIEIDFAHDDGVTVVNNKPAYSINFAYDAIERKIKEEILGPRNMTSFANKPMTIRTMRYCDGLLLEGDGDVFEEKFFWASISSPMFYLWNRRSGPADEFLRRCVLNGAWPTLVRETDENIALYQRYLPLFDQFRRRVFCFEPDPIQVPKGSTGKLYTVPDGYVAGIMNEHIDEHDQIKYGKTPEVRFRLKQRIAKVGVMYPGDKQMRDVQFTPTDGSVAVPLAEYKNSAVVKLFVASQPD